MRRRSSLAVTFVALLTVSWTVFTAQPGGSALAADPEAELAETRAQLEDAQSAQQSLQATLDRQRAEFALEIGSLENGPVHLPLQSRAVAGVQGLESLKRG